jgi:hypothetical protein
MYMSSLGKCLYKSFAYFLIGKLDFLLLISYDYLYITIVDPYCVYDWQLYFPNFWVVIVLYLEHLQRMTFLILIQPVMVNSRYKLDWHYF